MAKKQAVVEEAPVKSKMKTDIGRVTERLQEAAKGYMQARKQLHELLPECYTLAYRWVEWHCAEEGKAVRPIVERLGKMLGIGINAASIWYYCGKVMRAEGIDFRNVKAWSVYALYQCRNSVSDAEWRKAVQGVRDGKGPTWVRMIAAKSSVNAERNTEKKINKLMAAKRLTHAQLKLELMAVCTLAKKVFGKPVSITVNSPEGEELMKAQ